LSAKTVRPLTDNVIVSSPVAKNFNVDFMYYIDTEDATNAVTIQLAVQSAVEKYVLWQKSKLGRDINPTELYYRIRAAGAKRAEIIEPVFTKVEPYEVAIAGTPTITFGGLEDG
jgi:phage-related baseplate assembly protein